MTQERLTLRPMEREDFSWLHEMYADPELAKYMRSGAHDSPEQTLALMNRYFSGNNAAFILIEKKSGEKAGYVSMTAPDETPDEFSVTVMIRRAFSGQGYAAEGLNALISYARESGKARILSAYIVDENIASWKTAEKCGFKKVSAFPIQEHHQLFVYRMEL